MILIPPDINYFNFFGLKIYYYSICIFFAVLISLLCGLFFIKRFKLSVNKEIVLDFVPFLIIAAIIGARLYYVLLSSDFFIKNPLLILMIWTGGISIHGAFIGGVVFGFFYFKRKKLPFFPYADFFSVVLPLGQAVGRWGNFFNSEAFGVPVAGNVPFLLFVKESYRPALLLGHEFFHPVFLYESFFDFLIFLILTYIMKKTANKIDGLIFFSYILLYSFIRLILEFFRLDTVCFVFGLPFPALISLIGIFVGICGIFFRIRQTK